MSFVGEIKRRKVFQVAAVYAVVAWLVIQVVDVINSLGNQFVRDWWSQAKGNFVVPYSNYIDRAIDQTDIDQASNQVDEQQ